MKFVLYLGLITLAALLPAASLANDLKDGIVICFSTPEPENIKITGDKGAYLAYRDYLEKSGLEHNLSYTSMGAGIGHILEDYVEGSNVGVWEGYIYYDRGVKTGGSFEVGSTGDFFLEKNSSSILGCQFLLEYPVCAFSKNEKISVGCDTKFAIK